MYVPKCVVTFLHAVSLWGEEEGRRRLHVSDANYTA